MFLFCVPVDFPDSATDSSRRDRYTQPPAVRDRGQLCHGECALCLPVTGLLVCKAQNGHSHRCASRRLTENLKAWAWLDGDVTRMAATQKVP